MKIRNFFVCVLVLFVLFALGCDKKSGQEAQSTVSVFGTGTVMVRPDMVQLSVSLSKIAQTTRAAQEEVSRMVRQTIDILMGAGVEEKNISTASLTFNSEYEYSSATRTLIGQKAEQRITFTVDGIQNNNDGISQIIDQLIGINGIELNQISFNVRNNTEYFVKSRELAYQKAVEKAEQYAGLSGLKVSGVLSISEEGAQNMIPFASAATNRTTFVNAQSYDGSAILPAGELEITTRIMAVFLLEPTVP